MDQIAAETAAVGIADIEVDNANLDVGKAAATYREHGCLVVRGLMAK